MGNVDLYVSLLKRFLRTVDDLMAKTRESLEVGDHPAAQLHVHTLKGVSANIGAQDIAQTAALLEQALNGQTTDSVVQQKLVNLLAATSSIHAGFEKISAVDLDPTQTEASALGGSASDMAAFMPKADKLVHLLRDDDPRAVQLARESEASLRTLFGKKGQEILNLCEDMELEMAASQLEQLMVGHIQKTQPGEQQDD
jgi:HPt (histidine-containing phosphotransfer) domain-containing protein